MLSTKYNERVWAGQVISWIKDEISNKRTIFQDVTNDQSVKGGDGPTKFPDILIFTDKVSGIIFNGWELKFPDTPVDNVEMLKNALEKAKTLHSDSFVTWNGKAAIIWKIPNNCYEIESLQKLKIYPDEQGINSRNDLAIRNNYLKNEKKLNNRLIEILHDLEQLFISGQIKEAINISGEIVDAITKCEEYFIPQMSKEILNKKNSDENFRQEFNKWKIYESATLQILSTSSRRIASIQPEDVLAKFIFYKIIGKILFFETLSTNISQLDSLNEIDSETDLKQKLDKCFQHAQEIDYQAVFEKDFTDELSFNPIIEKILFGLLCVINKFDFKVLPNTVIGNILQNLVPDSEKQKFGQYFTPELLAYLVAYPSIRNSKNIVLDPTSGTGTFLDVSYNLLNHLGNKNHQDLLDQIWGNDISHFPAILSVINLYKQSVTDVGNFPRVIRSNFFELFPGKTINIPDNKDINKKNNVSIPLFDSIVTNFPFIQQEDIPNDYLSEKFKTEFGDSQKAFIANNLFQINERSDYYVYCFYNSLKFLKPNGYISAITSNAWLGKNYGLQFKKFLIDNFSIKFIVRSNAEHWFKNSQVSTIFLILQKGASDIPTRFVTINKKLDDLFDKSDKCKLLDELNDFYLQIEYCNNPQNVYWKNIDNSQKIYEKNDRSITVSIVSNESLRVSINSQINWASFFYGENIFSSFEEKLVNPYESLYSCGRGTRTGQDDMFILSNKDILENGIEKDFLFPIIQSSKEITKIHDDHPIDTFLFVCDKSLDELQEKYPNSYNWISYWSRKRNKTGKLLPSVLATNKPYWYSLSPEEKANIYISINPNERIFFSYCDEERLLNQRLVAIRTNIENAKIVTALLNSVITLLMVEINGVPRNLGALDLNADFFKSKIKILNPNLLTTGQEQKIISKFISISERPVLTFEKEFNTNERKDFDKTIFECFDIPLALLPKYYDLLVETIKYRIEMKNK